MKEVTIPKGFKPFKITVNNRVYEYTPGETVTVPDDVAEVIDHIALPKEPKANSVIDNQGLSFTKDDAGKILQVNDKGTDVVWGGVSSTAALAIVPVSLAFGAGFSCDKTFRELQDMLGDGILPVLKDPVGYYHLNQRYGDKLVFTMASLTANGSGYDRMISGYMIGSDDSVSMIIETV